MIQKFTTSTPWGRVQHQKQIAPGLVQCDTAGHGGYWLSPERWQKLRALFPTQCSYGGEQWLEEDCDWALAALAFPECFDARSIFYAVATVQGSPDYMKEPRAWLNGGSAAALRLLAIAGEYQAQADKEEAEREARRKVDAEINKPISAAVSACPFEVRAETSFAVPVKPARQDEFFLGLGA
jgi:hypothetical protein